MFTIRYDATIDDELDNMFRNRILYTMTSLQAASTSQTHFLSPI
jgi:hypothetical protein